MPEPLTIRIASETDAEAYEGLMAAVFAENLDTLCPRPYVPTIEQVGIWISIHTGEHSVIFLAEHGQELVGLIHCTRLARPQMDHTVSIGLNVKKAERHKGVGKALLTNSIVWFDSVSSIDRLELEVMSNNVHAIHLYESLGFVCEGTKRGAVKKDDRYLDIHTMARVKHD
jgi:RimJ/RimL family protein N-acetyltransferase